MAVAASGRAPIPPVSTGRLRAEELGDERVGQPRLVFVGAPSAVDDQQVVDREGAERPHDVRGLGNLETGPEDAALAEQGLAELLALVTSPRRPSRAYEPGAADPVG